MNLREKMIDFCQIVVKSQKNIDKRYDDLLEFMAWGIKNLPEVVKKQIISSNVIVGKDNDSINKAYIQFTLQDYNWWKQYRKLNPHILIKDIKIIEQDVFNKIHNLASSSSFELTKEELEEVLKEIDKAYA